LQYLSGDQNTYAAAALGDITTNLRQRRANGRAVKVKAAA
jgi:hypothetical protein